MADAGNRLPVKPVAEPSVAVPSEHQQIDPVGAAQAHKLPGNVAIAQRRLDAGHLVFGKLRAESPGKGFQVRLVVPPLAVSGLFSMPLDRRTFDHMHQHQVRLVRPEPVPRPGASIIASLGLASSAMGDPAEPSLESGCGLDHVVRRHCGWLH